MVTSGYGIGQIAVDKSRSEPLRRPFHQQAVPEIKMRFAMRFSQCFSVCYASEFDLLGFY